MANQLDTLEQAILASTISSASKAELEGFLIALAQPQAYTKFASAQFPQVCSTVQLLLAAKISQESNAEAKRISRIALFISLLALVAGTVQAIAAVASWSSAAH